MAASEPPFGTSSDGSATSNVAWPGRMVSTILGPSTCSDKKLDPRFRFRACKKCADSVAPINLVMNTFLMILKGYLGVVGRSSALVADAIHSGADVVAAIMLIFGLRISRRPSDKEYPYGYGKIEFLVAILIYTSLICAGIFILADAVSAIVHKQCYSPSFFTLWGAIISIIVNEVMFRQSVCAGKQIKSPSMIANAYEKRADAVSSLAVFVGIMGAKMGCHIMDCVAAVVVAFYILKSSAEMIWEAIKGLLDGSLDEALVSTIRNSALSVPGVMSIEKLRTREIGQTAWIDLEVRVEGSHSIGTMEATKKAVKDAVAHGIQRQSKIVVYLRSPVPVGAD